MASGLPKIDVEGLKSFIDEAEIEELLNKKSTDKGKIREIIAKSLDKNRLELPEMAALLNADDPELVAEIKEGARELKRRIYGNRIVLFAPLYVGNDCINNCSYCGFRASNLELVRRTLSLKELEKEVRMLESRGHKRLILVYGQRAKFTKPKKERGKSAASTLMQHRLTLKDLRKSNRRVSGHSRSFRKLITKKPMSKCIRAV